MHRCKSTLRRIQGGFAFSTEGTDSMNEASGNRKRGFTSFRKVFRCFRVQSGFTLTELIIVLVFVGVALTSILLSFRTGLRTSVDSELLSLSAQLAEAKMEQIKSDKASFGYGYLTQQNYPPETDADGYSGYTRTVSITEYSGYKKVTVTVTHSGSPDVQLVTIFANY